MGALPSRTAPRARCGGAGASASRPASSGCLHPATASTPTSASIEGAHLPVSRGGRGCGCSRACSSLREADAVELAEPVRSPGRGPPRAPGARADAAARPRRISFIHEAAWHVPVRWFILFEDEERRLLQRRGRHWRLRYRTTTGRAMRRAERSTPVLRRAELDPIADMIVELYEWMSRVRPDLAARARLRRADRPHDLGRAGRRPQRPRHPGGARGALGAGSSLARRRSTRA